MYVCMYGLGVCVCVCVCVCVFVLIRVCVCRERERVGLCVCVERESWSSAGCLSPFPDLMFTLSLSLSLSLPTFPLPHLLSTPPYALLACAPLPFSPSPCLVWDIYGTYMGHMTYKGHMTPAPPCPSPPQAGSPAPYNILYSISLSRFFNSSHCTHFCCPIITLENTLIRGGVVLK